MDVQLTWDWDPGHFTSEVAAGQYARFQGTQVVCRGTLEEESGADPLIGVRELAELLEDTDLQQALAMTPSSYGRDRRPVDGSVFRVWIGGEPIIIGQDTADQPVPEGLQDLKARLEQLDQQQIALCVTGCGAQPVPKDRLACGAIAQTLGTTLCYPTPAQACTCACGASSDQPTHCSGLDDVNPSPRVDCLEAP